MPARPLDKRVEALEMMVMGSGGVIGQLGELRSDLKELRTDILQFRDETRAEFSALRQEMGVEFAAVRQEMGTEFAAVRQEMGTGFAAVRQEMGTEFAAVHQEIAGLDQKITAGDEETRRYALVLHEELRDLIKTLGEGLGDRRKSSTRTRKP